VSQKSFSIVKSEQENNNDRLTAFDPGNPGRPVPEKHSPTHTHPDQRASFIIFLHLQRSMASSLFNLPSHRHLFATHDRTSAACSAAIPMLCHLPLVSLLAPYLLSEQEKQTINQENLKARL